MKTGLTLGKFAPLHKGHQLMIETAIDEMDMVIVVVYDDPITTIPLKTRADWIRQLYPDITVIEGHKAPTDSGYTPEVMKIQEDYIKALLKNISVTHFYSSEPYGEHVSLALGAVDRRVDVKREQIPISATKIRNNPLQNRPFIHSIVYKDLITNVVLLGAPSTGKSTLSEVLAQHYDTQFMPEYGREYWEKHQVNRRLTMLQLQEIAMGHLAREDEYIQKSNRYLFTDTNALTTRLFSLYYHGHATDILNSLANKCHERYDVIFVCDTDIPYDDTWDRSGDANRMEFQKKIFADLKARGLSYTLISGSMQERVKQVESVLNDFRKY
ncbi:AAA family ATPase [Maribacter sp. TH_r10]|uniref:AAA family ATPase n=1 Tax=Maribacter sp. TH_r10 TaxID=3082086 RepID=UPI0029540545|nr:AAA family ATPase [Maribacter sp. TH_r10]MDV7137761.1 AAA family ATPase [Maribacter sp. TH_r10]